MYFNCRHILADLHVVHLIFVRVELAVFQLILHVAPTVHMCALSVLDRSRCVQQLAHMQATVHVWSREYLNVLMFAITCPLTRRSAGQWTHIVIVQFRQQHIYLIKIFIKLQSFVFTDLFACVIRNNELMTMRGFVYIQQNHACPVA